MNLLLIVGSANDIFIYNYAKWLKASMDVTIDVFEFYPSNKQGYGHEFYDSVCSAKSCGIPKLRRLIDVYIKSKNLAGFLKGRDYDIIHCHWIVPPVVLVKDLKLYCRKLVVTFWGGEFTHADILCSKRLFQKHLDRFVENVDAIVNDSESESALEARLPKFHGEYYGAELGSAPIGELYELMLKEDKYTSQKALGISPGRIVVLIGYSGKQIHQHLQIIELLEKHEELKSRLHLLAPMTRGANEKYTELVEKRLQKSGYSYTIISGRFLSDKEVAQIRNATQITLQLSTFDGFSRSIIECLCAKSILIYGEWLGYTKHLTQTGFIGIGVRSMEEGVNVIPEVLEKMENYDEVLLSNYEKGKSKYLWSECIHNWVNAYKDLLR